jgi:hypothetical protein
METRKIQLDYYNPQCSSCIHCTSCKSVTLDDFKKMHFIYGSIKSGYSVSMESENVFSLKPGTLFKDTLTEEISFKNSLKNRPVLRRVKSSPCL